MSCSNRVYRVLGFFLFLFLFFPFLWAAKRKVVRVGWFPSLYNSYDVKGYRTGYGYDFQRAIAANTGWKYEYVEGEWNELFQKLQCGELDLLADFVIYPGREDGVLLSEQAMGREDCYIVYSRKNKKIRRGKPETLDGLRILVKTNRVQAHMLAQYMRHHHIDAQLTFRNVTDEGLVQALANGECDAVACNNTLASLSMGETVSYGNIGSADVWFAVNKNRPDLKAELDEAMKTINSYNPDFQRDLFNKYFWNSKHILRSTSKEEAWLRQHGSLRIGYLEYYLPFCAKDPDTGELTGVLGDFVQTMNREMSLYGVHVEAIPYRSFTDALGDLKGGKLDAAFPNGLSPSAAEQDGVLVTDPLLRSTQLAIVRKGFDFNPNRNLRVCVRGDNTKIVETAHEQFPLWDVVLFPSQEACLKGIADDKADAMIASNFRISKFLQEMERLGLTTAPTGNMVDHSFAVREGDVHLFSILSRMVHSVPGDVVDTALAKYINPIEDASIGGFLRSHVVFFTFFFLGLTLVFIFLLLTVLRDRHRASVANQAKTRFLFNMSHDIRTPMNAILGYTDLLKKDENLSPRSRSYVDKVRTSGRFLMQLINNVLEMSRIESGKLELSEQPQRIGQVLVGPVESFLELMHEKNIRFTYINHIHSKALYCDGVKINQIVLNLLSNAYKYTPEGGTVTLTTEERENPIPGYTTIVTRVCDTGVGMSADFLPHIFEDFTRERTYTDNKIFGTGLGMSIVKHLVDLMHGTIEVESELGKGSTFIVSLPHCIADETLLCPTDKQAEDLPDFHGRHVLLAEDNELNAEIAIELLSQQGFQVTRVADGQECVDRISQDAADTYDVILMDIQMPRLNGYDATRLIRRLGDSQKASIPIVAMTANAFEEDRKNALDAGMNGHVSKPIDLPKLLHTLQAVMR